MNDRLLFLQIKQRWKASQNKGSKVIDLHEGTKVYVKKVEGRWKKVQPDGTVGWIDSEAIREVK
jgi:SH3-like domain-containing protein